MKNAIKIITALSLLGLLLLPSYSDDADPTPYFSAPNVLSIRIEEGTASKNPVARGNLLMRLDSPLEIVSDTFSSGGAVWHLGVDAASLKTNLDEAYDASPSANKNITVDDGAFKLTSAANYGEIFTGWSGTYGFHLYDDGFFGCIGNWGSGTTLPWSGAGTRMFWYPRKAAFRAGLVDSTMWDNANIGVNSVAFGYATLANGTESTALNYVTTASGAASMAWGNTTIASGAASTAYGVNCSTAGDNSICGGTNVNLSAAADYSFLWGYSNAPITLTDSYTFNIYGENFIFNESHAAVTARFETDSYSNALDITDSGVTVGSGALYSGDTDTAGSFIFWDGSANKFTMNIPAMGADQTITMPVTTPGTYSGLMQFTAANPAVGSWIGDKQHVGGSATITGIGAVPGALVHENIPYSATFGVVSERAGTITGLSVSSDFLTAPAGSTLNINADVNGGTVATYQIIAPVQNGYATFALGTYNFAAGDILGMSATIVFNDGSPHTVQLIGDFEYKTR